MFAAIIWGACAGMGATWLVRARGVRWLWLTAAVVTGLLVVLSLSVSQLATARDGMSGVSTRFFPLAAVLTAACAHLAHWRRLSPAAGIMGSVVSWLVLVGPSSWFA